MQLLSPMELKHIACPVDFSDASRVAVNAAVALAKDADASLTLLHVYHFPAAYFMPEAPVPPSMLEELRIDAEQRLAGLRRDMEAAGAGRVTAEVLSGVPWDEIVKWLRAHAECDLVVMGTHGRTGLKHVILGSVAEKVVRHAPCAVLVARSRGA